MNDSIFDREGYLFMKKIAARCERQELALWITFFGMPHIAEAVFVCWAIIS